MDSYRRGDGACLIKYGGEWGRKTATSTSGLSVHVALTRACTRRCADMHAHNFFHWRKYPATRGLAGSWREKTVLLGGGEGTLTESKGSCFWFCVPKFPQGSMSGRKSGHLGSMSSSKLADAVPVSSLFRLNWSWVFVQAYTVLWVNSPHSLILSLFQSLPCPWVPLCHFTVSFMLSCDTYTVLCIYRKSRNHKEEKTPDICLSDACLIC